MKKVPLIILVLLLLAACSTLRIARPPESYTEPPATPKYSTINIPFRFDPATIERMVNRQLTGLIYADTSFDDNNHDNLMIKAWKEDQIHITIVKNEFQYSVPLRVWINKRFSIGSFGITLSDTKEVNAEILLKFRTKVSINKNWTVTTTTVSDGYEWISTPQIKLGSVSVPVPYLSDLIVTGNLSAVNSGIDKALQGMVDIRKTMQKAWTDIQTPVQVSTDYPLWARITPVEVSILPLQGNSGVLNPTVGIKAITEIYYNEIPDSTVNDQLPDLKITSRLDDDFNINLPVKVSYEQLNVLARQQLSGYTMNQGKYHIRVKDLFVFGSGDKLVVALNVEGSLNGTVYVAGRPYFDKDSAAIRIRDLDFDIRTKNVLIKSASWVYHQGLIRMVNDKLSYPIGDQLAQTRQTLQSYFDKNQKLEMFRISGKIDKIDIEDFQITKKTVNVLCVFGGKISVSLNDE
jgi:hypothetical protein